MHRAIDQRAIRARLSRPSARNASRESSKRAIAPSSSPAAWRAQPMLLASDPTQRRASGSGELRASSIARSFQRAPSSAGSTMPSMWAASTASPSSPEARASSHASRYAARPRPSRCSNRSTRPRSSRSRTRPRAILRAERALGLVEALVGLVELALQPLSASELRQRLREQRAAALDPGATREHEEPLLAARRIVVVPERVERLQRDGCGIDVHAVRSASHSVPCAVVQMENGFVRLACGLVGRAAPRTRRAWRRSRRRACRPSRLPGARRRAPPSVRPRAAAGARPRSARAARRRHGAL